MCVFGSIFVAKKIGGPIYDFNGLDVATVIMFLTLTKQFTRPINQIAQLYTGLLNALAGAERVFSILDEEVINHVAEIFEEKFNGKEVYIKYYITDEETTIEDIEEKYIEKLFGLVQASIYPVYSDITGYLWTNEEIKVNGHNLFKELDFYVGKFINILILLYVNLRRVNLFFSFIYGGAQKFILFRRKFCFVRLIFSKCIYKV